MEYSLETFQRSNQDTCLTHKPSVFEGTWVQSGDLLTDCASSVGGELSLGQNLLIAYMPWEGYNFEDAILISERLVRDDLYTSVHIERYELETLRPPKTSAESKQQTKGRSGAEEITRNIPDVSEKEIQKLDSYGIIKRGSWVEEGDILVGKITPINKKTISPYQKLLYTILEKQVKPIKDSSLRAPKGIKAKVVDIKYFLRKRREPMRNLTKSTTSQSRTTLVKEQFKNQRFACTDACTDARSAPMHAPLQNRRFCSEAHPSGVQEALQKSEIFVRSARSASARSAPSQKAKLFDKTAFFLKTRSCQKPKVVKGRSNAVFFEETLQGQKRSASVASVHQKPLHQKPTIFGRSELLFEKKNKQSFLVPRSSATLQITAPVQKSTIFVAFKKQSLKKRFINSLLKTLAKSSTVNLLGVQKSHVNRQFWKSAFLLYKQKMNNNKKLDFVLLNFFKKFKKKPLRSTLPKGPVQALRFAFRKKTTFFERKQTERPSPKFGKKGKLPILSLISGSGNKRKGYSKSSAFAFGGASLAPSFFASPLEIRKAQQFKKNCVIVEKRRARKSEIIQNIETIHIYLAEKRKVQVGDKMAGRHGNKGIVSQILPIQDMPYLPDGTPIDMVLNPLGVPSRMNVGQIYECLLGLAGKYLGENYKIPSFDEAYGADASRSFVFNKLFQARMQTGANWLFDPNSPGKMRLYDGRNGECFLQPVTVGQAYILRLVHMVDDKIHARSTGPYSLVTQQPLRGRSKQGGQRLGEMEVWALEGYGAAFTLLEMLTIKSDDMTGRMTLWSNLILNKDIAIGTPESFKVLVCELQALCLDIGLFRYSQPMSHAPSATPQLSAPEGSEAAKQGKGNDFNKFSLREINSLINLP
uniref:DNA-directed RNA polymerase n=2 Tax=Chlorosarcinopsis eremi TaxID=332213 RepID=A0A5C2FQI4_9CHLO|nr:RNA polymerase beta subunit protein b [Chlorosarcinopsis eremi]